MAWTTPSTVVAGQTLSAAFWNEQVRDNLTQLGTGYTYVTTVYFTSSGTFTKATYPYLRAIRVKCQAGGGGGGGSGTNNARGGGGGGGAYTEGFFTDIAGLNASETVTVGANGTGGAAGNTAGTGGGDSSFGTLIVAGGGGAGAAANAGSSGLPNGGIATTPGDFSISGDSGWIRTSISPTSLSAGGDSFLGKGGPAWVYTAQQPGRAAEVGYGGGGGGGWRISVSQEGADGKPGIVIVELYA